MEELIYLLKQLKFIWKPTKVFTSHWGRKKREGGKRPKSLNYIILQDSTCSGPPIIYLLLCSFWIIFLKLLPLLLAFLKYITNGGLICCCSLWLECYSQRCLHKFLLQKFKISTLYLGFSIMYFLAHYLKLQFIPTEASTYNVPDLFSSLTAGQNSVKIGLCILFI